MKQHYTCISIVLILFFSALTFSCKKNDRNTDTENTTSISAEESDDYSIQTSGFRNTGNRIKINNIGPLREVFNDSNKYQYKYAEKLGISPIETIREAYFTSKPIVHITSCNEYTVDSLTHSMPFLVPQAANLLKTIGRNFIDSLRNRGADGYRIRVTSLLRTSSTVKKLRRVNINATDSSTHKFATTFDLSYTRFDTIRPTASITQGDLKNLLAEVLLDLRNQKRCLVKFEAKTGCFHITATK